MHVDLFLRGESEIHEKW